MGNRAARKRRRREERGEKPRCAGLTPSGTRCKRPGTFEVLLEGSVYPLCEQHKLAVELQVRRNQRVRRADAVAENLIERDAQERHERQLEEEHRARVETLLRGVRHG